MPQKQKLALVGVFSLTLVITILSIVRFALNAPGTGAIVPSWLHVWSLIEQSLAVIISCFASFRIYIMHKAKRSPSSSNQGRYMNSFIARKIRSASKQSGFSHIESSGPVASAQERSRDSMDIELLDVAQAGDPRQRGTKTDEGELGVVANAAKKGGNEAAM